MINIVKIVHIVRPNWLEVEKAILFFFFNVYLFSTERERQTDRQSASRGGTQREGEESQAGPALSAQSPMQG